MDNGYVVNMWKSFHGHIMMYIPLYPCHKWIMPTTNYVNPQHASTISH